MLFKFNFSPGVFELFLESFSISLSKTFLDSVRSTVNEILSFLQAKTGEFLNELNNGELACTCALQYYVERSLFLGSGSTGSRTSIPYSSFKILASSFTSVTVRFTNCSAKAFKSAIVLYDLNLFIFLFIVLF